MIYSYMINVFFCFRGRQLAEQMQNQHPELVEQLRSQMNRGGGNNGGPGGSNPSNNS